MEGMEVKVGLVVMVGLGQKLPWHQWGKTAAVRYHTGSCCAPFASSPSLPKLHHHHQAHLHLHPLHLHHRQLVLTMRIP